MMVKQIRLTIILAILLLAATGCSSQNRIVHVKNANNITIYYSFSNYAMFGAEQSVIDELSQMFDGLSLTRTDEEMDFTTTFIITFINDKKVVEKIDVDINGICMLDGKLPHYKQAPGSFDYYRLRQIFNDSRGNASGTYPDLPVLSVAETAKMATWKDPLPSNFSIGDIEDTSVIHADAKLYQLTPLSLWNNQKMQMYGIGWDTPEGSLGLYRLYFIDDGHTYRFDQNDGLMGYLINQVYLADLNNDGLYEIYTNSSAGSGISNDFVQFYDPKTKTISGLNKRSITDYSLTIYNNQLYLIARPGIASSASGGRIYRPIMSDGILSYVSIDQTLQDLILADIKVE